jgi:hypothetical protein
MMIKYSPGPLRKRGQTHSDVQWATWHSNINSAFANLRKKACNDSKDLSMQSQDQKNSFMGSHVAVGFKLMYDQVPAQLMGKFLSYVAAQNISVVHLVREATVLRLASHQQTSVAHTSNATLAQQLHYELMKWTDGQAVAIAVKEIEEMHVKWQLRLQMYPLIRYHYVSYESLLGSLRSFYLAECVRSLGLHAVDEPYAQIAASLVQLHEPTCEQRVERYHALAPFLNGTRSESACAMLAGRPLDTMTELSLACSICF